MKCLVATLGFDADFVLRRLMKEEQGRLVCLALHVEEQAWSRVERAFALVKYYCETRRMECELQKIGKENVLGEVLEVLERELKRCDVLTLYLTGGPRLLVASAIFSSLLLPPWEGERVTLEVEGEGFEARLEVSMKAFSALLSMDEIEKAIVAEALKGPVRPSELPKRIKIAKSTAYRKVKELEKMRVLVKRDGAAVEEYFLSEDLRRAIRV